MRIPMLLRFSLYGFLKNQRYFEPFLVLVLLEKGFTFLLVGTLVAFREVTVNLLEIPSGALADAWGRRGSMILSFAAYTLSFFLFGFASSVPAIFVAMAFFAVGEAFRTGTHKAMIFEWLRREGRTSERTRVYGYTRSWSKIGSAVSGLLAASFVVAADSYTWVFYFAAVPAILNIVNFLGYPRELDGEHAKARSPGEVARHLRRALGDAWRRPGLRRLIGESMGFEGVFHAAKDYLQPLLQALVLASFAVAAGGGLSDTRKTALLVGPVYFVLHLLSAAASRRSHRLAEAAGSEDAAAWRLWMAAALTYVVLAGSGFVELHVLTVVAFVVLHVLQNLWRPILISRFDQRSEAEQGATVLSIESQSHRAATMVAAPLLGWAVDTVRASGPGGALWPVGVLGVVVAAGFFVTSAARPRA